MIRNILRHHKGKIFLFFASVIVFLIMFFPYNDVGDVATSRIYQLSNQQVFLQFDRMSFSVIPQPGFSFSKVSVETPLLPTLRADLISLAPSISGLLSFKPGVSAKAEGLFKGKVSLTTRGAEANKQAVMKHKVDLAMSAVDLTSLVRFLNSPLDLAGTASAETSTIFDPSFLDQPDGTFELTVDKAKLLPSTLPIPMGGAMVPLPLPGFDFQSLAIEGSIKNGVIKIDKLNLGSNKDELSAKVTGQFDFRLVAAGGAVRPQPGAFDFGIELDVQPGGERKLGTYWSLLESQIEKFKRAGPEGRKSFAFRVSAPSMGAVPTIAPLNRQ